MEYYVYQHKNPQDESIVYVGLGSFERAWLCRGSNRSKEHQEMLKDLFKKGYTMADIVEITHQKIDKETAKKIETLMIFEIQPKFNKQGNDNWNYPSRFTEEIKDMAKSLKQMGYGCQNIAYLLGGNKKENAMTIWRMVNG